MHLSDPTQPLRILLIEDREDDAGLLLGEMERQHIRCRALRVDDIDHLKQALHDSWDVIIADDHSQGIHGFEILSLTHDLAPDTPFFLVSGLGTAGSVTFKQLCVCTPVVHGDLSQLPLIIEQERYRRSIAKTLPCRSGQIDTASVLSLFTVSQIINAWSLSIEKSLPVFLGHQRRVAQLAAAIGEKMDLDADRLHGLHVAAMLHDIGKIWQPSELWMKTEPLLPHEWASVKQHPEIGYSVLRTIPLPWNTADIVHQHHELLDGSGYPQGIAGDAIALEARIITVADAVEAMSATRPYRDSYSPHRILETIESSAGVAYDTNVVATCKTLIGDTAFAFA